LTARATLPLSMFWRDAAEDAFFRHYLVFLLLLSIDIDTHYYYACCHYA